jgi:hypothetical protein
MMCMSEIRGNDLLDEYMSCELGEKVDGDKRD